MDSPADPDPTTTPKLNVEKLSWLTCEFISAKPSTDRSSTEVLPNIELGGKGGSQSKQNISIQSTCELISVISS